MIRSDFDSALNLTDHFSESTTQMALFEKLYRLYNSKWYIWLESGTNIDLLSDNFYQTDFFMRYSKDEFIEKHKIYEKARKSLERQ